VSDGVGAPGSPWAEAADVCARPWPSRVEALEQATWLRRDDWVVPASTGPGVPREDGTVVVASVYDPRDWSSPGDISYQVDRSG
jgi:hypothetical protein